MSLFDPILDRLRGRPPIVSVVTLSGVIVRSGRFSRGLSLAGLADRLEAAFKPKPVSAVALVINSPGGSPVQSDLIGRRIRDLAREHDKPVIAFVEDVAASGGYWLACAADEIFVNPSSIVGSIGVISSGFGFQEAIDKLGIERRVHTAGSRKSLLDPFRPEDPKDLEVLGAIQTEMHQTFKTWVTERREGRLKPEEEPDLFEGRFWTGARAVDLGLADGIGELRRVMRDRYGKKTRFRLLGEQRGLARRLGLASADPADLVEQGLDGLEARAHWSRFGL